jgi:hypothetical protein
MTGALLPRMLALRKDGTHGDSGETAYLDPF